MIRKSLFTIAAACIGVLFASQAEAQTENIILPQQTINTELPSMHIMQLTLIPNEEYTLIADEGQHLGEMAHPLGKDDQVTCGFCGTNDDDEELPFEAGKMDWNGHIEVYPNPTADHFFIKGGSYMLSIQLLAMDGRLVRSIQPTAEAIPVDDLAPGLYLLQLDNGARVVTRKLVVQ